MNSRNRCQAPTGVIFPRGLLNDGIHLIDSLGELIEFELELSQQHTERVG